MRLRRLSESAVEERGRLRSHFLMDAGDLGSRNLTVTWVDVPPGAAQRAHSHEEAEQSLVACGFRVVDVRDAPGRPGREFVFVAERK